MARRRLWLACLLLLRACTPNDALPEDNTLPLLRLPVIIDGGEHHVRFGLADDASAVARSFGARFGLSHANCAALAEQMAAVQRAMSPHDITLVPVVAVALSLAEALAEATAGTHSGTPHNWPALCEEWMEVAAPPPGDVARAAVAHAVAMREAEAVIGAGALSPRRLALLGGALRALRAAPGLAKRSHAVGVALHQLAHNDTRVQREARRWMERSIEQTGGACTPLYTLNLAWLLLRWPKAAGAAATAEAEAAASDVLSRTVDGGWAPGGESVPCPGAAAAAEWVSVVELLAQLRYTAALRLATARGQQLHYRRLLEQVLALPRVSADVAYRAADAHNNLGVLGGGIKRGAAATAVRASAAHVRAAVALRPSHALFHNHLGMLMLRSNQPDEAFACLCRVLCLEPALAAVFNLAFMLDGMEPAASVAANGAWRDALLARLALRLPQSAAVGLSVSGTTTADVGAVGGCTASDVGGAAVAEAGAVAMGTARFFFLLSMQLPAVYSSEVAAAAWVRRCYRDALALPALLQGVREGGGGEVVIADPAYEVQSTLFKLAYQGAPAWQLRRTLEAFARAWDVAAGSALRFAAPHLLLPPPLPLAAAAAAAAAAHRRPIRVGLASVFFRHHTVCKLLHGLIARLPRPSFHVTVFSLVDRDAAALRDELTARVREDADVFIEVAAANLTAMHAAIGDMALDVLLFPDVGMSPTSVYLAFARLAPTQVLFWGHPVTTGVRGGVDYFVLPEHSVGWASEDAQDSATEQLVRMGRLTTYFFRPPEPPPPDHALPSPGDALAQLSAAAQAVLRQLPPPVLPHAARATLAASPSLVPNLYGCPQMLKKFHPSVDGTLLAILRDDPHGLLLVQNGSRVDFVVDRLARRAPELARRLVVVPSSLSHRDFLALLRACAAVLDLFPFPSGVTSLDAFAVGAPVVTLGAAQAAAGLPQLTAGMYRLMAEEGGAKGGGGSVGCCVARTTAEYAALVVRLGTDAVFRRHVSEHIVARRAVLFEDDGAVAEWTKFLTRAVRQQRLQDGVAVTDLVVGAP